MNKTELTKVLHKEYHLKFKASMSDHGFKRYKSNDYLRVTTDNIAQRINIQKHSWDVMFTFNITVFPLFFESAFMYFAFGGLRIGQFKTGNDHWSRYSNKDEICAALMDIDDLFRSQIFLFYDRIDSADRLYNYVTDEASIFGYPNNYQNDIDQLSSYLNAYGDQKDKFITTIKYNCEQFGINPKKFAVSFN